MAEDLERPAQTLQHEVNSNEETVQMYEKLQEDTDGHKEQGEAASDHSRHRDETSRPHEDRSDRTTRSCSTESQASQQTFTCWHGGIESSEIEEFIYRGSAYPTIRWPMNSYICRASATICRAIAAFCARRCRLWGLGFPV